MKTQELLNFELFFEHHSKEFYSDENDEFCYCTKIVCSECILESHCKSVKQWDQPPYISQVDFQNFKENNPEFFI